MPSSLKRIFFLALLFILFNVGAIWYGQASFQATFQGLARAFVEHNATVSHHTSLPQPIARYLQRSGVSSAPYRAILFEKKGLYRKSPTSKPMDIHAIALMRPSIEWLWALQIEAQTPLRFHAIQTYRTGHAIRKTSLFGLIPLDTTDNRAFSKSQLARVVAYGVLNPLLLTNQAIVYTPLDHHRIKAKVRDGNVSATLEFHFDANGDIYEVSSDDVLPWSPKAPKGHWRLLTQAYKTFGTLRLPCQLYERYDTPKGHFDQLQLTIKEIRSL